MQISSKENSFKGVFTALVTPFFQDGQIDWKSYEALLEVQLAARVHGVVSCGTTGEAPTLLNEEKQRLISLTIKKCQGKALVIAGTGSNDTRKTIEDSKWASEAGVDALLVVTPYYNKPSQAGLEAHYMALADSVSAPIILYNVPSRTGVSLEATTVAHLSQHPRIIGIKEATGNLNFLKELQLKVQDISKKYFYFLSGDDPSFWPFLTCGGDGIISVASNTLPRCMLELFNHWNKKQIEKGVILHENLLSFFRALFIEPNPVPIKALLSLKNKMSPAVRLPLVQMQEKAANELKRIWESLPKRLQEDLSDA